MWITISNIADKFRLKIKRLFYAQGPEVSYGYFRAIYYRHMGAMYSGLQVSFRTKKKFLYRSFLPATLSSQSGAFFKRQIR